MSNLLALRLLNVQTGHSHHVCDVLLSAAAHSQLIRFYCSLPWTQDQQLLLRLWFQPHVRNLLHVSYVAINANLYADASDDGCYSSSLPPSWLSSSLYDTSSITLHIDIFIYFCPCTLDLYRVAHGGIFFVRYHSFWRCRCLTYHQSSKYPQIYLCTVNPNFA